MSSAWAGLIFSRACGAVNQAHRSTSGNVSHRPEPRGHSVLIVLLITRSGSASPSQAQACTNFPAFCRMAPSGMNGPWGGSPVSSSNSRHAAANRSSPGSGTPFGMVHAPASRCRQNGPPGCARNSSRPRDCRRYSSSPALALEDVRAPTRYHGGRECRKLRPAGKGTDSNVWSL
jgi:hypothetical protein